MLSNDIKFGSNKTHNILWKIAAFPFLLIGVLSMIEDEMSGSGIIKTSFSVWMIKVAIFVNEALMIGEYLTFRIFLNFFSFSSKSMTKTRLELTTTTNSSSPSFGVLPT